MKIATVAGTSATTERRHGLVHRRPHATPSPQLKPLQASRRQHHQGLPDWQDNNAQLAAGKHAGVARAARLHPGSGASPNPRGRAGSEPLEPLVSPVKELHQFAGPGTSSPPSKAHFERGTWYQKHGEVVEERPVLPYREKVVESWQQHQQTAALYEEAIRHKRKTLGDTHASTLLSVRKLAELCEIRGDMVQAEMLFAEAFAGYARKHGDEHPDAVLTERDLARVRAKLPARTKDPPELSGTDLRDELNALLSVTLPMAIDDAVSELPAGSPSVSAAVFPSPLSLRGAVAQGAETQRTGPAAAFASTAAASSVREVFRDVPGFSLSLSLCVCVCGC